mmetsp:Transcript_7844/g.31051  ORF Transcript_7844/g.31051 Transcript_7844/m.31051 type:complete len:241 (+) Transcript_7844:322-1044(+)
MILEGRATHPPDLPYSDLAASSASSPGPNSRIRLRCESIPEPTRSGSNAQCRWYTWLCPENTALTRYRVNSGQTWDWNSSATPTSLASRRSSSDPSFPSSEELGFFGPHVHARSSTSASTPAHDFPQSESTSPGRCPANKTQGVIDRSIDPSASSSHVHCGEFVRKSTSVFMDTSAIGPRIATYAPGTELGAGVGPGSNRSTGTPHSPPESTPPYTSAYVCAVPPVAPPPPACPAHADRT